MSTDLDITPSDIVSKRKQAHAQSLIRMKANQLAKIDERLDWEDFLEHIASGAAQYEYCDKVGINDGSLAIWLAQLEPARAAQLAIARRCRAESCVDRGLQELEKARKATESHEVTLAGLFDKHWSRRATISNREYSERPLPPDQSAPLQAPPQFLVQVITAPGQNPTVNICQSDDTSLI